MSISQGINSSGGPVGLELICWVHHSSGGTVLKKSGGITTSYSSGASQILTITFDSPRPNANYFCVVTVNDGTTNPATVRASANVKVTATTLPEFHIAVYQ